MPRKKQPKDVARARELRTKLSLPEVLLWTELRKQREVKFRRQHSPKCYVLDFYCAKAKVCIEVDGIAHDMGNRPEQDEVRDEILWEEGIEVVRVPATDVLADAGAVAESLVLFCKR